MKQAEEQLRTHKEDLERLVAERTSELEEKNEGLKHFTKFAGHEMKKDLEHICVEMKEPMVLEKVLKEGRKQVAIRAMSEWVWSEAKDGLERIDAMLRWAGLEAWQSKPKVAYDCQDIFTRACHRLAETITKTGAKVTSDPLPKVLAYQAATARDQPPELVMLFENLINNALKYRSRSRPPEIRVTAQRKGEQWEFTFEDNGIGIDAKYFDGTKGFVQIFDMFGRLHGDKIPGHGIGLAYCKRVVEGLGGKIWVKSMVDKGSTFCFTLPALPHDRAGEPPDAGQPPKGGDSTTPSAQTDLGKPRPAAGRSS
jgi:light-regulated signal transduction histidine kinase (bacteriophytochrome)